jgi:hypothetical protein
MNFSKALLDGTFDHASLKYCFHHGKSGQQKVAENQTGYALGQQKYLSDKSQGTLNQFEGPVQDSPFYKALTTTGIENTSRAYDRAKSGMRERANMSGFGYNQPVEQGGENQLASQEASSLAEVPRDAMLSVAPLALGAAGQTGNAALEFGRQGMDANQMAYGMNKQRGSIWDDLFKVGALTSKFVAPFIGGGAGAVAGGGGGGGGGSSDAGSMGF